jgi:hypothetical protein
MSAVRSLSEEKPTGKADPIYQYMPCRELLELSGFVAHQLSASVVSVVGLVGLVGNALALSTNPQGLKVATSKQITRRPSAHR